MALSSVFMRLALVIAPALASNVVRKVVAEGSGQLRSNRVAVGAWSSAVAQSKSQIGLPFWRALRKELEAKKKDLALADTRESSSTTHRDLLWQAVREVDDKFHQQKFMCALEGGTTYAKDAMFMQGHAAYSKINIASPRECALMCAADSLADPSHKNLACRSFAYNRTAQECKFYNFAHQEGHTRVKDACCTTGPPCNLASMREEIQTHFQVELKRTILKAPSKHHVAAKVELKSGESQYPYPQPMIPMQQPMSPYMQPISPAMQPVPQPMIPMQPMPQVQPMQQPYMQPVPQAQPMQPMPQVQPMQQPYMQPMPRAQPIVPAYKAPAAMPPRYPSAPMAYHPGQITPVAKPKVVHRFAWWFLHLALVMVIAFATAKGISAWSMNKQRHEAQRSTSGKWRSSVTS